MRPKGIENLAAFSATEESSSSIGKREEDSFHRDSRSRSEKKGKTSTANSTWWCGPRLYLDWVKMALGLPEGPSYPGHSPHTKHFRLTGYRLYK